MGKCTTKKERVLMNPLDTPMLNRNYLTSPAMNFWQVVFSQFIMFSHHCF